MTKIKPKKIINKHNLYFILKSLASHMYSSVLHQFIPQKWHFKVLSIVKYQKIQLCFTMQYWHNSKYCANYKQYNQVSNIFSNIFKGKQIDTHLYAHNLLYSCNQTYFIKANSFIPQLVCILTQFHTCSKIFSSCVYRFSGEGIKMKLNFTRTHIYPPSQNNPVIQDW